LIIRLLTLLKLIYASFSRGNFDGVHFGEVCRKRNFTADPAEQFVKMLLQIVSEQKPALNFSLS